MTLKIYDGSNWNTASDFKFYNGSSWTSATKGYVYTGSSWSQFYPDAPSAYTNPSFTGNYQTGQILYGNAGGWTGNPTYTYQWQRCYANQVVVTDISGATSINYTLTNSDIGYYIRLKVTATNTRGSTSATSSTNAGQAVTPSLITGLTGSKTGSGSAYFSWNASTGAGSGGTSTLYAGNYSYGSTTINFTTNNTNYSFSGWTAGPNVNFQVWPLYMLYTQAGSQLQVPGYTASYLLMNVYP